MAITPAQERSRASIARRLEKVRDLDVHPAAARRAKDDEHTVAALQVLPMGGCLLLLCPFKLRASDLESFPEQVILDTVEERALVRALTNHINPPYIR